MKRLFRTGALLLTESILVYPVIGELRNNTQYNYNIPVCF